MANADMFPPATFLESHPALHTLLVNEPVAADFSKHEAVAVAAKRDYTQLGVLMLGAAFLTFAAVIFAVTLEPWLIPDPEARPSESLAFRIVIGAAGFAGVCVQLYLLRGPLKRRWLDARFAAERLRCIKFQAFQAAASSVTANAAVQQFSRAALGKLAVELNDAQAARHHFDAEHALVETPPASEALPPDRLAALKAAYRELRVDYQTQFAVGSIKKLSEERRLPAAASEIAFWTGALLAYIDAVIALAGPIFNFDDIAVRPLIHFLTLLLFVASALLFVLERGRSHNAALERYEDYRLAMTRVAGNLERARTAEDFVECVRAGERVALRELKAFCREAESSTYIF